MHGAIRPRPRTNPMELNLHCTTHVAGSATCLRLPDTQCRQSPACHRQQLLNGTNHQVRTIELNVVATPRGDDPFAVRRERGQLALELLLGLVVFLQDLWCDRRGRWY